MKRFTSNNMYQQKSKRSFLKVSILLISFLVFFTFVSANIVSEEEVIELGEPTKVSITKNYHGMTSSQVSVTVPQMHEPENIDGFDENGSLECVYREIWGKEIVCQIPDDIPENYSATISYETPSVSTIKDEYLLFEHQKRVLVPTDKYSLEVILPEGSGIISRDDLEPFSPEDAVTGSEGRRIFVRWDVDEISLGETRDFSVRYQELDVLSNIFPIDMTTLAIILILLISLGISVYFKFKKKEDTISSILPLLKEDEKEVLLNIIEKEGECEQRNLVRELDYSKAKISRLVKDLEERNLIKKIKEGRKNRIVLKKDVGNIERKD